MLLDGKTFQSIADSRTDNNLNMEGGENSTTCRGCDKRFESYSSLLFHAHTCEALARARKGFLCDICGRSFRRGWNYRRHRETTHANDLGLNEGNMSTAKMFACGICNISFPFRAQMKEHRRNAHERMTTDFREVQSAHRRAIQVLRLDYPRDENIVDAVSALRHSHETLCMEIERQKAICGLFKFSIVLTVEFIQIDEENLVSQSIVVPFRSKMIRVLPMADIDDDITEAYELIQNSIVSFVNRGSGWILDDIMHIDIEVAKCLDLAGSCFSSHTISWNAKCGYVLSNDGFVDDTASSQVADEDLLGGRLINTELFPTPHTNADCFYIAMARHFNRKTRDRNMLLHYAVCNFNNIKPSKVPVSLKDIDAFENANGNVAVNVVFQDEEDKLIPARASPRVSATHQVLLLLVYARPTTLASSAPMSKKDTEALMHYVCIEDHADFLSKRVRTFRQMRKYARYPCYNCFNGFSSPSALFNHTKYCHENKHQRFIYPRRGDCMEFRAGYKGSMVPFVIYFDFESSHKAPRAPCKCDEETLEYTNASECKKIRMELDQIMRHTCEGTPYRRLRTCKHKTVVENVQKAIAYHIIAVDREGEVVEERKYIGEDAAARFCDDILDIEEILQHRMDIVVPMKLTHEQARQAEEAEVCYICEKPLEDDGVRDHDHLSGAFLGVAHNLCNLRRRELKKIVAFSHNFTG